METKGRDTSVLASRGCESAGCQLQHADATAAAAAAAAAAAVAVVAAVVTSPPLTLMMAS